MKVESKQASGTYRVEHVHTDDELAALRPRWTVMLAESQHARISHHLRVDKYLLAAPGRRLAALAAKGN